VRGDKRDYAPVSPIEFIAKLSEMFFKLSRLARGVKRVDAPMSPK